MSKHIPVLSRRQFLRKTAFLAGFAPLANITLPSFISAAIIPVSINDNLVQSASVSLSHGILVLDTTLTARAQYIATHLTSIGTAVAAAGNSIDSTREAVSRFQAQTGLLATGFTAIGLGMSVPHVLKLATTGQISRLVIDLSETAEIDLSAEFEALKTSSVRTLIVQNLPSSSLSRITRFIQFN